MVVGLPGLPMGSWRDHLLRSKFPPGAQLGFRAEAAPRRPEAIRVLRAGIMAVEIPLERKG